MIRLHLKKQICMEDGYMLDSNNILIYSLVTMGGLFGIMLSFYLLLCWIQWVADVIDEKRWQDWRYWFNG